MAELYIACGTPAQVPDLHMLQDEELFLCPHMPHDKLND